MSMQQDMSKELQMHAEPAVYVYEAPIRIWHWINAFAIFTLALTGYFIGQPPPSIPGEPTFTFLFGYIRFFHFAAGYILLIGFLFRVYWAFAGNHHARQIFLPQVWRKDFWEGVVHELKWYFFLAKEPKKYVGHNPLATLIMHIMFVWGTIFMIVTGLALYGEGTGMGTWQYDWFSSWVIPLFGQSMDVHTWHRVGMWWIIIFVIVHIYAAVREDIMSRQTIISSMISGWRNFRDPSRKPGDEI